MKKLSYPKDKMKIFLLEKIHPSAQEVFSRAGYHAEGLDAAPEADELAKLAAKAHVLGVRSRTILDRAVLEHAKRLLCIGCFSVGTDQVSLETARMLGVPVFNAPFSSTRSVAELTLANIFALSRKMAEKSAKMHQGAWEKSAQGSFEVRNKVLGIVGYGHIGQQIGLLAEAVGMDVLYYDLVRKLPLGRARSVRTLELLLGQADFVTLHVPGTPRTEKLIGERELASMKRGSYLLNLSRGKVVDLAALRSALESGHLAGAAVDVYPSEPARSVDHFESELSHLENVILTPHIGGSTEEAQASIGREVAETLVDFLDNGSTAGSVNFPSVHLPSFPKAHRILYVHKNVPGALSEVTQAIFELGANIDAQYLSTYEDIGYLIMDINRELSEEVKERITQLPHNIRTRILY